MLTTLSTYKGWFYVLVTGLLLYWLIHRNNSRIQRDTAELQVAEKNYKEMFDHATVGIYRSTPDGRLLAANPKLASMFGYDSPEEMLASISDIGKQVYKDSTRREEYQETITEQGFINDFVNEERRKDGSWIWTSTTARGVKDDAGNILYYEGFSTDTTESKHAEEQLLESEQRFSKIFHASPIGINIFRLSDNRCQNVNDAFLEMTGYSRQEIIGYSAAELNLFANPEIRPVWMKRLNEGQGVQNQDARIRMKSGELREMLASMDLIDINSETMALVIMSDITERKLTEEKLLASETQYRRLFESRQRRHPHSGWRYGRDRGCQSIFGRNAGLFPGGIPWKTTLGNWLVQRHCGQQRCLFEITTRRICSLRKSTASNQRWTTDLGGVREQRL